MSVIQNNLLLAGDDAYNLQRSLRFRSSASAYLNRTPASVGNRQTWTWSAWVKRGSLGSVQHLFSEWQFGGGNNNQHRIFFGSDDRLTFMYYDGPSDTYIAAKTPAMLFRDPASWYHIVCTWDTTNATASDRVRVFVNGVRQTTFNSTNGAGGGGDINPSQNTNGLINLAELHTIGSFYNPSFGSPMNFFDGYLAEVNFINAQALTPSSFGQNNAQTGVWQPKKYSGTYGTNGFYLPFSDNSSLSNLTADRSGNGNNWTANNISLSSGATYDSMTDVPTLTSATQANYCVLNPLNASPSYTYNGGNLNLVFDAAADSHATTTMTVTSGTWYAEGAMTAFGGNSGAGGFCVLDGNLQWNSANASSSGRIEYRVSGAIIFNGSTVATVASYTTNDIIGITIDATNNQVRFYKNNTLQHTQSSMTFGSYMFGYYGNGGSGRTMSTSFNFGQRPFAYTPPTGFVALNTFNLPTPTIGATASTQANKYFDATTYTGNGSTQTITNAGGFSPDFVWTKGRSFGYTHILSDSVRGANKQLQSNATDAELSLTNCITSFISNGFTVGSNGGTNNNNDAYVAWQWKASGSTVTNTAGSITSTVSANTSSGFSVVTYTGTLSNATVGHGLGVAPKMVIVKNRTSNTDIWVVWHIGLTNASYYLSLNQTAAQTSAPIVWNSTAPTSTVFSVGTSSATNTTQNYVAYCFAEVAGFSRFGSYTGNGSTDGPFVFCGFRPKYVMIKRTDGGTNSWEIRDSARDTYNTVDDRLFANSSSAEDANNEGIDFLSNGFKIRNSGSGCNISSGSYIFAAFAEVPTKFALAR